MKQKKWFPSPRDDAGAFWGHALLFAIVIYLLWPGILRSPPPQPEQLLNADAVEVVSTR